MLQITFLGTGTSQGIPVIGSTHPVCKSDNVKDKRLRSSILLNWKMFTYVIDCGPDFRYQMLRSNCDKINGVFFTHEHSDHVAGLDDLRPFYFNQGELHVYAHKRVVENLKKRYDYIFDNKNKYPGIPVIKPINISNIPFNVNGLDIVPINVYHNKLQVFGFRIKNFAYITDMKTISVKELKKLSNLDTLVLNCLRIEEHHSHLNLTEAIELVEKINPKVCYFTHISHHLGFHEEVEKRLPKNIFLAYDELSLTVS
ncbi:MAG: MBL fold metallo-hydrolase [Flavobacteriales bacterium]|tara:strand:+ start:636 stop:1403 length:768 start_codon:yes stop_codon:yes gene_type:complete